VVSLCARVGLPASLVDRALELQRMMAAKGGQGLGSYAQTVVCLHLAANQAGAAVDSKAMAKVAGMKTKQMYDSACSTAESLLGLDSVLSVQEVAVRLGFGHLATQAASVLKTYTAHLASGLAKAATSHLSLERSLYPCAAVATAARLAGEKADISKCAELGRCKRKELVEVVEEMVKAAPDAKNGPSSVKKEHQDFMEQIMGVEEKIDQENSETKKGIRDRIKEEDFEDDGFEEWRQQILRKAVDAGHVKYKKFLVDVQ